MDLYGDLPKARDGDAKAKEWAKAPVLVPVATIRPLERDKKRKRPTPPATLAPRQALVRPTQGGDAVAKGGRGEGAAASSSGRGTSSRANAPASSRQPASINAVLDDAYDPLKPNDYMAELESRAAREEEAKRREHEQRCAGMREFLRFLKESERTYTDSREQIDGLRISGEEAYLRRARIGQAPSVPAGPDASAHQASQPAMSVAEKLMAKMGWRKGDGLGKAKQGIKTALEAEVVGAGRGRMVGANEKPSGEAAGDGATLPTRVLVLLNMVGPGEADEELESEVACECQSKYGRVTRVTAVEATQGVRIFVAFGSPMEAMKAHAGLNGRFFGGRKVVANFFSPERFEKGDLHTP